jgi:hypothetical protein
VGLELGPLSLESKIEELLERESRGYFLESRDYGRRDLFTTHRKNWHLLRRQAAVALSIEFAREVRPRSGRFKC